MKDRRIVVLQRGWVVVGEYAEDAKDKNEVVLTDGAVVRRWGTENGLGELASEGPKCETKLDPIPELRVHRLGVVFSLRCNEASWKK